MFNSKFKGMRRAVGARIAVVLVLAILMSFFSCAAGDTVYVNSRWLADNLEYTNTVTYGASAGRGESFAIRLAGPGDAYPIVMKGDTIYGKFKISGMVSYAESLGKNVLAAVNSDFFSMQTGVPLGVVIEDGEYKSSSEGLNAVCFGYDGSVSFVDSPVVTMTLANNGGGGGEDVDNSGKTVILENFNKYRADTGGMYMFSEAFSTVSTRTASSGWFVKFKIIIGKPSVNGAVLLEVTEMLRSDKAMEIGEGYMVLTAADQCGYGSEYEKFAVGDVVVLTFSCEDENVANAKYATGGGNMIVCDGEKADSDEWEKDLKPKAPRTALGVREDGSVVSYVIDGRNSQHSVGMTMDELVDEMLRLGCVNAINFDGGGSSALSVRLPGEGLHTVVNKPSDGTERGCATYILFVTDAKSDGRAKNLSLANDGAIVLARSSIELSFAASDNGYMPANVPFDVKALPSVEGASVGASVAGATYTTGSEAGTETVTLFSPSTGARGTGNVVVIGAPTSLVVSRKGSTKPLISAKMKPGELLELGFSATYYRRAVTCQALSFEYEITGDIGEMVEPGVFRAGQSMFKMGSIVVSALGTRFEVKIDVGGFVDMGNHWAREYAEFLAYAGIAKGVTETEYGPERMMKRGDFVLMLYRAAGEPKEDETDMDDSDDGATDVDVETPDDYGDNDNDKATSDNGGGYTDIQPPNTDNDIPNPVASAASSRSDTQLLPLSHNSEGLLRAPLFDDVDPDDYYADAIAWAREMGITDGTGDNKFSPQAPLSRQQAFTFVYRALGVLNIRYANGTVADLAGFADADAVADYAAIPTATLIKLGIVEGSNGKLTPQATLNRAQMAKILAVTLGLVKN